MNYKNQDTFISGMMPQALQDNLLSGPVDFSQAAKVKVDKDLYLEAQKKGLALSELLELPEFDPRGHEPDAKRLGQYDSVSDPGSGVEHHLAGVRCTYHA